MNIARGMLRAAVLVLLPCAARGLHVEVPPPAPEYADTEASTNVAFNRVRADAREVRLHFSFAGVPSNCVQVAFGRDADGDGVLSFGETDAVYGWRNGRRFAEDARAGVRTEEDGGASGSFEMRLRLAKDSRPARLEAEDGSGAAALGGLSSPVPAWLYRPEWNLMRVTRRGPGVPAEWFSCDIKYNDFYMTFR